jgi:HAD superfamily hydrolase (TIGR01490 family)
MNSPTMATHDPPTAPPPRQAVCSGGVALFDLDGTLTRRDTYLAYLLGFLVRHPTRLPRALPLPLAVASHLAGWRDNTWLKATFLHAVLGGVPRSSLEAWTQLFVERLLQRGLRPRARDIIARHRAAGDRLVLVTASFDFYAEPLAERLDLDEVVCTRAAWDGSGRLTGHLEGSNCYGEAKLRRVRELLVGWPGQRMIACYTDHHTDLPLLRYVHRPVAVNPTRQLRIVAVRLGIPIQDWNDQTGRDGVAEKAPAGFGSVRRYLDPE